MNFLIMEIVLSILTLIWIGSTDAYPCPTRCTCKFIGPQAERLKVKCDDHLRDIGDVDISAVSVELIQLDLSKNDISVIEKNAFKNLTNLRRLNMSTNKITTINEGSFNGLENLERLDLSKNQISTIDVYAFKKLLNLKKLDLSGNKISALPTSLFHDLVALDRLKLNANSLTTLTEGIFHGLSFLKQLDLSSNPWVCDCDLYWFGDWIRNTSIKLTPPPKCASPANIKGQSIRKLHLSENFQCQWRSPVIEIKPVQDQVVFAGDSITLKCRAPGITEDRTARLNWLWYPNATTEMLDLNAYKDPQTSLSNIKIENRFLSDSGIVDSSLSILPIQDEHNGQWNCLLISTNGNRSKAISMIVISDRTRYCPLAVTKNNKGIYTWPRTIVGWKAELPCEGSRSSGLLQASSRASYRCDETGNWEELNTESCPYISHTTKVLEQFSKVNLSLTKGSLLETAKRFKNYTADGAKITDPVEVNFITQTIENYLDFLIDEKELGSMLIDVVSALMTLPREMLRMAQLRFKSCTRLIKAVEKITEFTPSIQSHKKNMALEELRVKRDNFAGLRCTWYSDLVAAGVDPQTRSLHCTTNNKTVSIDTRDKVIEAFIQLPPSLLQNTRDVVSHPLMVSMYNDDRLFPKTFENNDMDISTCIVGSKLIGVSVHNLTEPVYVMLKAPSYRYTGKRPKPVVWDETSNKSAGWTTEGCHLTKLLNDVIIFHCNRLGYYGLFQDTSYLPHDNNDSMRGAKFKYSNPAIYLGSFIIITCLAITSVTYIICYASISMPKKAKHCVVNMWFAMALLSFLYTIGIRQTENIRICQGVGLTLHYLSLCCLFWMAVSASNMYKRLSKPPELNVIPDDELPDEQPIPKPLLGLYLVGWGIALIICGISGAINLREYAGYSRCFLTSGPALAALFVPATILIVYLIIFYLLIRCTIRGIDANAQLSEGTQATENMDLELLEPNLNPLANVLADGTSIRSTRTVSSDMEDGEHSQTSQLKGQIVTLILYLASWASAAGATAKPFGSQVPFEETAFACLYAFSSGCLGLFILLFYGIARSDVRARWLEMRCWLRRRKNRCCRSRSVSDANPVVGLAPPPQQPPNSNSQATRVTSDANSTSSKTTTDFTSPAATKLANVNLVVLHRRQYRSNDSVTTYAEPARVEMFYDPRQSGVARKFFRKQRRHAKNDNLGPRKQGDGGATSDAGSCISIPRGNLARLPKISKPENDIERSILSGGSKVNNTNIHVEFEPTRDPKTNLNVLSDSGGSFSEERNRLPTRLVVARESLVRNIDKRRNMADVDEDDDEFTRNAIASHDSDADVKTDDEKQLKNVSQQCSLEYSSEIESTAPINSERSDQNLPEICESAEATEEDPEDPPGGCCLSSNRTSLDNDDDELMFSRPLPSSRSVSSLYERRIERDTPLRRSARSLSTTSETHLSNKNDRNHSDDPAASGSTKKETSV